MKTMFSGSIRSINCSSNSSWNMTHPNGCPLKKRKTACTRILLFFPKSVSNSYITQPKPSISNYRHSCWEIYVRSDWMTDKACVFSTTTELLFFKQVLHFNAQKTKIALKTNCISNSSKSLGQWRQSLNLTQNLFLFL